jgi:hypothetical protein
MVNVDRVKRKLPSLLVDSKTTEKEGWSSLMRYRYRMAKFKKNNQERYNTLTNRLIVDLVEIEKAVNS